MADDKSDKPEKAPKQAKAGAGDDKAKKKKGKKDDVKKAGFAANIEEGVEAVPARLKLRYRQDIVPSLMKEFGFKNPMQAPRLEKIVVNMGLGEAIQNGKILDASVGQLAQITGQKPVVTKARRRARFSRSIRPTSRRWADSLSLS